LGILILGLSSRIKMNQPKTPLRVPRALAVQYDPGNPVNPVQTTFLIFVAFCKNESFPNRNQRRSILPIFLKPSFWRQKVGFKAKNEAFFQGYVNNIKRLLRSDPTTEIFTSPFRPHPHH
jgi:hypothetical protein